MGEASLRWCATCGAGYRAEFARCPNDGGLLNADGVDPLLGATVGGHYVIDDLVGEGGMGRVYRAHHVHLTQREFAIKVLLGDLASSSQMRMRFTQEAQTASALSHPNVVSVVDFGRTDNGLLYLAMDFVRGRSLANLIVAEGPLPAPRVIALATQMCAGLAHAHERGLVHRDFKPDNVLVVVEDGREVVRIVDFGIALAANSEVSARLTTAGIALGTPAYASPEQTHGEDIDHRADLFALGVTLYEMLAARLPYDGNAMEMIHLNARGTPPSFASRGVEGVPPGLEAIVQRLLQRSPSARFGSAQEVATALAEALAAPASPGAGVVSPKDLAAAQARALPDPRRAATDRVAVAVTAKRRTWRWLAGAVALLAGGVAVAVVVASGPSKTPATPVVTAAPVEPPLTPPAPASETPPPTVSPLTPPTPAVASGEPVGPIAPSEAPKTRVPTSARPTSAIPPGPPPDVAPDVAPDVPPEQPRVEPEAVDPPTVAVLPPPVPEPPPVKTPNPTPVVPTSFRLARAALTGLETQGSLSAATVRPAVDKLVMQVNTCIAAQPVTATRNSMTVKATFAVDDTRRATNVRLAGAELPGLAACVRPAFSGLRTSAAPDVGETTVSIAITFREGK